MVGEAFIIASGTIQVLVLGVLFKMSKNLGRIDFILCRLTNHCRLFNGENQSLGSSAYYEKEEKEKEV